MSIVSVFIDNGEPVRTFTRHTHRSLTKGVRLSNTNARVRFVHSRLPGTVLEQFESVSKILLA